MKIRFALTLPLVLVAVLVLSAAPAQAGLIVVDQSSFRGGGGTQGFGTQADTYPSYPAKITLIAQSFTVRNDGVFSGIDILTGGAQASGYEGLLEVYLVPVVGGLPVTDLALALEKVSTFVDWRGDGGGIPPTPLSISGFTTAVSHGDILAFVLAGEFRPGKTTFFSVERSDFSYASGGQFDGLVLGGPGASPVPWVVRSGIDLAFRTYVDCADSLNCVEASDPPALPPPNVPEGPSSLLLPIAVGFVMLAAWKWRKKEEPA